MGCCRNWNNFLDTEFLKLHECIGTQIEIGQQMQNGTSRCLFKQKKNVVKIILEYVLYQIFHSPQIRFSSSLQNILISSTPMTLAIEQPRITYI